MYKIDIHDKNITGLEAQLF